MIIKKSVKSPLIASIEFGYGTKAIDIYDQCCNIFKWNANKRLSFSSQQLLWSKNVTPQGYSGWFLCNNSWLNNTNGRHYNIIYFNDNKVEEVWLEKSTGLYTDMDTRVTFAKTKEGQYVFLGVYKPVGVEMVRQKYDLVIGNKIYKQEGEIVYVKTYKKISDTYK